MIKKLYPPCTAFTRSLRWVPVFVAGAGCAEAPSSQIRPPGEGAGPSVPEKRAEWSMQDRPCGVVFLGSDGIAVCNRVDGRVYIIPRGSKSGPIEQIGKSVALKSPAALIARVGSDTLLVRDRAGAAALFSDEFEQYRTISYDAMLPRSLLRTALGTTPGGGIIYELRAARVNMTDMRSHLEHEQAINLRTEIVVTFPGDSAQTLFAVPGGEERVIRVDEKPAV